MNKNYSILFVGIIALIVIPTSVYAYLCGICLIAATCGTTGVCGDTCYYGGLPDCEPFGLQCSFPYADSDRSCNYATVSGDYCFYSGTNVPYCSDTGWACWNSNCYMCVGNKRRVGSGACTSSGCGGTLSCVKGQCGAECAVGSDCASGNCDPDSCVCRDPEPPPCYPGAICGTSTCYDHCVGTTWYDYPPTCNRLYTSTCSCPSCTCSPSAVYPNDPRCQVNPCSPSYLSWTVGTVDECYGLCSSNNCMSSCYAEDYAAYGYPGVVGCSCTQSKDGLACGSTRACPADYCSGTTLYDYPATCSDMCSGGNCLTCSCTANVIANGCAPACTASCGTCTRSSSTSCTGTQTCTRTDCSTYTQNCNVAAGTSCGTTTCPADYCSGTTKYDYPSTCTKSCSGGTCQACTCSANVIPNGCPATCTASCGTCTQSSPTSCTGTQTCTRTDCSTYTQSCNVASGISCGTQDCDYLDGCSGSTFRNYNDCTRSCSSGSCSACSCTYSSDSCTDCSCTCGGYGVTESTANGNCNDGIDNDCDGFTDGSDTGCGATCTNDAQCPSDGWYCNAGNVRLYKNYYCSGGQCLSSDSSQEDCDNYDGCYGNDYRDYSCSGGSCTYVTTVNGCAATCTPNGCNGNCPAGCTVSQDPDCGCSNGNGCCGIGCNSGNDNDCIIPTISVSSSPSSVPADGSTSSSIRATLANGASGVWVSFSTTLGALSSTGCSTSGGTCAVTLRSSSTGTATVISSASGYTSGSTFVSFTTTCTPNCAGKSCGDDGCGGSCGTCSSGYWCDNGVCRLICTPSTCFSMGKDCGYWYDGCSVTLYCGSCSFGYACNNGVCTYCNDCTSSSDCGSTSYGSCGSFSDVCDETGTMSVTTPNCADNNGDNCNECSFPISYQSCSRNTDGVDCPGVCSICSGGTCSGFPADDSGCGTIDCDMLDNTCRNYFDLTTNRCEGLGDCKDANSGDCTSYEDLDGTACGIQECDSSDSCDATNPNIFNDYHDCNFLCSGGSCLSSCTCGLDQHDCSQAGDWNGNGIACNCDCNGYDVEENETNGNTCSDGIDNDCDGLVDGEEYVCPGNTMTFTGNLQYSTGYAVSDSRIEVRVENSVLGIERSAFNQTAANGDFIVTLLNLPTNLMSEDFDMSIYVEGEVDALYECRYDVDDDYCYPV